MLNYADFSKRRQRAQSFALLLKQLRFAPASGKQGRRANAPTPRRRPQQTLPAPIALETSIKELPAFVVGLPLVHPRQFFGHGLIVKRLFNLLKDRPLQNAVLIGPRRSGKTSLLLYLKNLMTLAVTAPAQLRPEQRVGLLPQPERYRWLFVDFQDPRLGSREGLLCYLLDNLNLPIPKPCDLEGFMEVVSRNLRTPTVILLDEIDVALARCPELNDSFWEGLRALATTQVDGNLSFVLAASARPDQLARHSGIGSPFFNIFGYTVTLKPLSEAEARELIASSPIPFPQSDVEWILVRSKCWPILLQILCRERLFTLEDCATVCATDSVTDGAVDDAWREEGLRQIEPFRHLLESQ